MKWLFLFMILITTMVFGDTAWYYNPDRSGEGIVLTEIDDGRLVFAFYSHTKERTYMPPIVSPPPPPPLYCDEYKVWFTGHSDLYANGIAMGNVYYDVVNDDFPLATNGAVSQSVKIGEFLIEAEGDGFVLYMENNGVMCNLTVFDEPHLFTTKLVE